MLYASFSKCLSLTSVKLHGMASFIFFQLELTDMMRVNLGSLCNGGEFVIFGTLEEVIIFRDEGWLFVSILIFSSPVR